MSNRTSRILLGVRDIPLIVFSVVIMRTSYGKWIEEPVHYVLFSIAVGFALLSVVDLMFVLRKRGRRFHFVNAYFQ
ncbi:hypothetical protein GF319_04680, partial [Candidatus Bathyarchaeota archaeon]|nr:hypothetical protein [Candidatus Bathyarchaeota archaeon]